jgi:5-methylcytosine-specific restriction endonuclease McrA
VLTAHRAKCRSHYELAVLLCEVADSGAHNVLGFAHIVEYATTTLELDSRETRDLLYIGRRLRTLPATQAAMSAGELGWTKVRELVRVADPSNEAEWVAFASRSTSRELEKRVAKAAPGDTPEVAATRESPPRGSRIRRVIELEATDNEVFSVALAVIRAQSGGGDEISDGVALAAILRRFLETAADDDEKHVPTKPVPTEPYRVVIRECPTCSAVSTVDGHDVSDTILAEACCDHEEVDLTPGPHVGQLTRAIPETMRRRVLDRDDYRCSVPGCCNRVWLHFHHLQFWSDGGRHELQNLTMLCSCHHRLVHEGFLAIERRKDGRIEVRAAGRSVVSDPLRAPMSLSPVDRHPAACG